MRRRDFLKWVIATSLLSSCGRRGEAPRIGLALGGGGAKGLAHIPVLEVLDELKLRPHHIAGCSIGAVIGALYAAGKSGKDIRAIVDRLTVSDNESWLDSLFSEDVAQWFDFIELRLGNGGLVDASAFMKYLHRQLGVDRFSQLAIPLSVVATDLWSREPVHFSEGNLLTAVNASIAIPGLFEPVHYDNRVLVDGGLVNPVPYDLLFDDCDVVIAVDVLGVRTPSDDDHPGYFETSFNTFQIMQASIMREKRRLREPDIYLKPEIENVRVLEFYKADMIYEQTRGEKERLRRYLQQKIPRQG